jgi:hypothetical protein
VGRAFIPAQTLPIYVRVGDTVGGGALRAEDGLTRMLRIVPLTAADKDEDAEEDETYQD